MGRKLQRGSSTSALNRHLNLLNQRSWCWYRVTIDSHALNMKLNRLTNQLAGFLKREACGHTPG